MRRTRIKVPYRSILSIIVTCFFLLPLSYVVLLIVYKKEGSEEFSNIGPTYNISLYPQVKDILTSDTYPSFSPLLSLLSEWNPDSTSIPKYFTETLQHFNYSDSRERALAEKYRAAELPFKVYDVPMFDKVARLWTKTYLSRNFKHTRYHVEESKSNHFMYWATSRNNLNTTFRTPTKLVSDILNFDDWSIKAEQADIVKLGKDSSHYYFMTGSRRSDNDDNFVYRDLPVFRSDKSNFFIPNPKQNKGIQCRFGMRGVIAEAHFDSGRNSVAMIKGQKRYILAPPESCKRLAIISDKKHPSFRHSIVDWSDLTQARDHGFQSVRSVETILRAGEVLYIPSFWFHYIVSLDYSIQCNSRSGFPENMKGKKEIEKCTNIRIKSI